VESLHAALATRRPDGDPVLRYQRVHRILAEGCFVLAACEGAHHGVHSALYDLFRLDSGNIVEHWNSIEEIPPRSEWKNTNGKF
jgi:predicted SnoaL-like aldol condensation-catalyzing enzyme